MILPDEVTLIKNGEVVKENIPADVQPEIIFIDDHKIPLEEGDILQRTLPNGIEENYKVLDKGFFSNNSGGEYQAKVKKVTALSNESDKTVFNLHGENSRVNISSNDNSINIVDKSSQEFFADLRSTVKNEIPDSEKEELLKRIDKLENSVGTESYSEKYAKFMAIAANHTTVLAPYFPALLQFLA